MKKFEQYFKQNMNLFFVLFLFLGCILFIFANIGLYPLIDIDETRYVNMSKYMYLTKEYVTPVLNFEPFLEKPPLYFWLNVIVFKFLGYKSIFACRFATGVLACYSVIITYFFARKISKSELFGFLSANILLTSAWFLVFSHIAILDLSFMAFSMSAIYSAILSLFVEKEKNKKYCWYFGYFFMALAVLAKGFIGIAIPSMVVFFVFLAFKKVKEIFNPINILVGSLIFFIVALPWHILIYKAHGFDWVYMYIFKHHFARLLTSEDLGRKQPFLFYLPIMLLGLIPWTFNFILIIYRDLKRIKNFKPLNLKLDTIDKKIMTFAFIYFISVFVFFSIASTKLPSYILALYPALAFIVADLWYRAIKYNEMINLLKISNYINFSLFLICSLSGLIFALTYHKFLPENIEYYVTNAFGFSIPALIFIALISIFSIIFMKKRKLIQIFLAHVALMLGVIFVICDFGLPYYTSFAQDELVNFANYVYSQKDANLITYGFSAKYSILNPFKKIKYIRGEENINFADLTNSIYSEKNKQFYIITRKYIDDLENKKEYVKIKEGAVYSIYKEQVK